MKPSSSFIRLIGWGIVTLSVALLSGCVSYAPSVPEDYSGPIANIRDSAEVHGDSKVDYFYANTIDGKTVKNSHLESIARNQGRGFYMEPVILDRDVPARRLVVEIVGRTAYAAPILALTQSVYEVKGSVELSAEAEGRYVVKGVLSKDYSAVWLEDATSGEPVGERIEINGSAKLGFFQK